MASVPNKTSSTASELTTFSIAIIGGGIGGLALALGLNKHANIDYHVYEAAPAFGEIGAGVSIGVNSERALEMIGPEAKAAFDKHATGNMWPSQANIWANYTVGKGPDAGTTIASLRNSAGQQSVHRSKLLDELVKAVPSHRSHFNKRVISLEDTIDGPVVIHFKDGTTATADAVIGADGVHSAVRAHLLGKEAAQPVYTGTQVYRGLVPMEAAVEKLGDEWAHNCYNTCGPDGGVLSYPIDHGSTLNIAAISFNHKTWDDDQWIVPVQWSKLDKLFEGWGRQSRALIELLDKDGLCVWALWDMPPAPTYYKKSVSMLGDAAHAATPFQGQGAGQAIEDALVLETLLGKVKDKSQISNAFSAYDQVRRPRSQKIVTTSREAGDLMGMRKEGVGDDVVKMKKEMETRMHWIWGRDLKAQNKEAVRLFQESI